MEFVLLRNERLISDKTGKQLKALKLLFKSKESGTVKDFFSGKMITLSHNAITLGLMFLNGIPRLKDEYQYGRFAPIGSKRVQKFKDILLEDTVWDGEYYNLLLYFFGEEQAPYVKQVWKQLPNFMYQTGHHRRSFRAPNHPLYSLAHRINTITALNEKINYNISLKEYIIYDNGIYRDSIGVYGQEYIWAAAIDDGNNDIYKLIIDIIHRNHDIGIITRPLIKALLCCKKREAWEIVGNLLISAKRQEGLRQTILECLDETSFDAMKYIIKLILDNKLTRFSSVIRAVDVWGGFNWKDTKEKTVHRFLERGLYYLENPSDIKKGITQKDNTEIYMALWAQGVIDVEQCFPLIEIILKSKDIEKQCLALFFVSQTDLYNNNLSIVNKALKENKQEVNTFATHILLSLHQQDIVLASKSQRENIFNLLENAIENTPKKDDIISGKVFSWLNIITGQNGIFTAMIKLCDEKNDDKIKRLFPYLPSMDISNREYLTTVILGGYHSNKRKKLTPLQKEFALLSFTDKSAYTSRCALEALHNADVNDDELLPLEKGLKRKSGYARQNIISILLNKKDNQIELTIKRLLASRSQPQRLAGLDMLNKIYEQKKMTQWAKDTAKEYAERTTATEEEQVLLSKLIQVDNSSEDYSKENGFGLFNPKNRSPLVEPTTPQTGIYLEKIKENPFALSIPPEEIHKELLSLKRLLKKHGDFEYEREHWDGSMQTTKLGLDFHPFKKDMKTMSNEEIYYNYPLPEVWKEWFEKSRLTTCDLFIITMNVNKTLTDKYAGKSFLLNTTKYLKQIVYFPKFIMDSGNTIYFWKNKLIQILQNLSLIYPFKEEFDFLNGFLNNFLAKVDVKERDTYKVIESGDSYSFTELHTWRNIELLKEYLDRYQKQTPKMDDKQFTSYWHIVNWGYHTLPIEVKKEDPTSIKLYDVCRAYVLRLITKDELTEHILTNGTLSILTSPPMKDELNYLEEYPFLVEIVNKCRDRIFEIELKRGDSATAVTDFANTLRRIYGVDNLVKIVNTIGKEPFDREVLNGDGCSAICDRKEILSSFLKYSYPSASDDQHIFNTTIEKANFSDKKLVSIAMFAPQWLSYISAYLKWDTMISAVYWLHAHINNDHSPETESTINKYTPISIDELNEGVVDIQWFKSVYKSLGKDNWNLLCKYAQYITYSGRQKKALLYSDAILGHITLKDVQDKLREKRNSDYIKQLGLIPLNKNRQKEDLIERYRAIQQFKKESKQFGAARQTKENTAVRIAMENLAQASGYADPIRLTWAMETEVSNQVMVDNPTLTFNNVEITLIVDDFGKAHIQTKKDGKTLKSIPAKLRKDQAVIALKDACSLTKEQYSRTRKGLEDAMTNGDIFEINEIESLINHPVVAPMLTKLVLKSGTTLGFYYEGKLIDYKGKIHSIKENITIAHCYDLFESGHWSNYQHYCFTKEIIQPFKQIFRELYTPTADEKKEVTLSRRYAGHQVRPAKTIALLKSKGWSVDYDEGLQKVFHKEGFVAKMYAMADWYSPADVECPTLETIEFKDKQTGKNIPFVDIETRIFSEVMRDIDLVVSVAHASGVDPEASHSSIEMRAAIVKETVQLFKLKNVTIEGSHVHIRGELGEYRVHLGSAVTFKKPGISLSIIPVHSQHRGRLFLPFVDEDPKSAEVMSKILLLAKDKEIKDPTILRQFD